MLTATVGSTTATSIPFVVLLSGLPPLPEMVLIPGGEFEMGDSFDEATDDELPVHAVDLSPYYIDKCEVTNQQYAEALNWAWAQGGLITVIDGVVCKYDQGADCKYCSTISAPTGPPDYGDSSQIIWNGSTFSVVMGKEDLPVTLVSWYGAVAYSNWRSGMAGKPLCYDLSTWECNFGTGYRLPTEAEWENAARGGVPGHRFPWSDADTIQHARANYYSFWEGGTPSYPYDTSPTEGFHPDFDDGSDPYTGQPYTNPVDYFAPNDYGVYGIAGNVFEWCNDWYSSSYYSVSPGSDPTGAESGTRRSLRGGAWFTSARDCRCACRTSNQPETLIFAFGFRCAAGAP